MGRVGRAARLTCRATLGTVALHTHVCIQVVERTVCLGAIGPRARVQTFNLVVPSARPLANGVSRERDERVRL